jgi:hypothetical protein
MIELVVSVGHPNAAVRLRQRVYAFEGGVAVYRKVLAVVGIGGEVTVVFAVGRRVGAGQEDGADE